MSKSYKHTPYAGEEQNKEDKQYANRRFRREKINYENDDYENLHHKGYKKKNESYDIRDFGEAFVTFEEYYEGRMKTWERWNKDKGIPAPTEKEIYRDYYKLFKRK